MFLETKHNFDSTFQKELSTILIDFMTLDEVFNKFAILNKKFNGIVTSLKTFNRVWREKYVQEFQSNDDRIQRRFVTPEQQERFLTIFNDNKYNPAEGSVFEFLQKSIKR